LSVVIHIAFAPAVDLVNGAVGCCLRRQDAIQLVVGEVLAAIRYPVVKVKFAALKQTKRHEYVVRFVFGGLVTVATGIIAKKFGPGIGGLFLAFPAIFPASATLVENRETEKKQRVGMEGTIRGRNAASLEARGAAMGSVGLIVFAIIVWQFLPGHLAWLVLAVATLAWLIVSVALWKLRKTIHGYQTQRHQRSGDQPDVR